MDQFLTISDVIGENFTSSSRHGYEIWASLNPTARMKGRNQPDQFSGGVRREPTILATNSFFPLGIRPEGSTHDIRDPDFHASALQIDGSDTLLLIDREGANGFTVFADLPISQRNAPGVVLILLFDDHEPIAINVSLDHYFSPPDQRSGGDLVTGVSNISSSGDPNAGQ